MSETGFLIFTIEEQRFGLRLDAIQRVERAVAITALYDMPSFITGIMDYHGEILPVFDLRKKMGLPARNVSASWRFLIISTSKRQIVVMADHVDGIIQVSPEMIRPANHFDETIQQPDFFRTEDGIIFIYDAEKFLTTDEEIMLQESINKQTPGTVT